MKYLILLFLTAFSLVSNAQDVEGTWKTYEDGELKSEIKIYKLNGKLYGKIVAVHNPDDGDYHPVCDQCNGQYQNEPLIGMVFIKGLRNDDGEWYADEGVLNPDDGEHYDIKIWLESNNKLAVRGYFGWFYRTQYWIRKT